MRPEYKIREVYIGNNALVNFTFDFKIADLAHLMVILTDDKDVVQFNVRATDTTYFNTTLDGEDGGTITFVTAPPTNYKVVILLADDAPTQPAKYGADTRYTMKKIEESFDTAGGQIQRIKYQLDRSLRLPEQFTDTFKAELDEIIAEGVVMVNETGDGFILVPRAQIAEPGADGANIIFTIAAGVPDSADGNDYDLYYDSTTSVLYQKISGSWIGVGTLGGGVPAGGVQGAVLEKDSVTDGDATWKPHTYSGISRFGAWSSTGLADTIAKILNITYTPPNISLSGSSNVLREKGTVVSGITLTASITKQSDPIAQVRFKQGATLLSTQSSGGAIPNGGNSSYVYAPSFSDDISFTAECDDNGATGGPSTRSSSTTYSFVYPYFDGANASGTLTAAQVASNLTKRIISTSASIARTFTANASDTLYFAQPSGYPALTQILDSNNFDVTSSWTSSTGTYTALDGSTQTLRVYKLTNPVAAGSYTFTFKR